MQQKSDYPQIVVNPFVIYIVAALLAFALQRLMPLPFFDKTTAQVIGAAILLCSLIPGVPAVRGMILARTSPNPRHSTTSLVQSGSFRFSRNPMYIGLTLMYCGLSLIFQSTWGLIFLPFVVWLITTLVILPEEKYLEEKFGGEYQTYKSNVRRWI